MPTITSLTELSAAPGENDVIAIVDLAAPVGTRTKKTKWSTLKAALKVVTDALYSDIAHTHVFEDIVAPTWTEVSSFQNSWVNYGTGYTTAAYCKDQFNFVHLKGMIQSGTSGLAAFTLPAGYRPSSICSFLSCNSDSGVLKKIEIFVNTDGTVVVYAAYTVYISLDGINFSIG
jgi:hypothetical protein